MRSSGVSFLQRLTDRLLGWYPYDSKKRRKRMAILVRLLVLLLCAAFVMAVIGGIVFLIIWLIKKGK